LESDLLHLEEQLGLRLVIDEKYTLNDDGCAQRDDGAHSPFSFFNVAPGVGHYIIA